MCVVSLTNGLCMKVNEAFVKFVGYSGQEMIGNHLPDLNIWVCMDDREKLIETIIKEGFIQNLETKLRMKSGEIKTWLVSGTSINWEGDNCFLAIGLDITELKRYKNELARLDRSNLIGQMAAGIGHEIRNPMTTVRGFLQLLMEKDQYTDDLEILELMVAELDQANSIITDFLSLAKTRHADLKRQSLNQKIRNLYPLIQAHALKQDKQIKIELGDIPFIVIDKNQIHQLLLNLVYNGLDAMPGRLFNYQDF